MIYKKTVFCLYMRTSRVKSVCIAALGSRGHEFERSYPEVARRNKYGTFGTIHGQFVGMNSEKNLSKKSIRKTFNSKYI